MPIEIQFQLWVKDPLRVEVSANSRKQMFTMTKVGYGSEVKSNLPLQVDNDFAESRIVIDARKTVYRKLWNSTVYGIPPL